jgi:hypothetical protein
MNKLYPPISALFFLPFIFSCTEPDPLPKRAIFMENFNFPDSLNTDLFVATYIEPDSGGYSVIVYNDTNKLLARRITYRSDSTVESDNLKSVKFNEFRSVDELYDYSIGDRRITMVSNRPVGTSWAGVNVNRGGFIRTDTNRVKRKTEIHL